MRPRKSEKCARSERGNGSGGSEGRIPLGMSAMLTIATVHVSGQWIVSDVTLSSKSNC